MNIGDRVYWTRTPRTADDVNTSGFGTIIWAFRPVGVDIWVVEADDGQEFNIVQLSGDTIEPVPL